MIFKLLCFLDENAISYKFLNGYLNLSERCDSNSDHDILIKKNDFKNIEEWITKFYMKYDFDMVQSFHQGEFAKNIFLFNPGNGDILNLDIYGEFSRKTNYFFDEEIIFQTRNFYKGISILSPYQEFIYYLIKKIDKGELNHDVFIYLRQLFINQRDLSSQVCKTFFKHKSEFIIEQFESNEPHVLIENSNLLLNDIRINLKRSPYYRLKDVSRIIKRIINPTGITIGFLGPDGSGKSTIINGLINEPLPFRRNDYFHLKPFKKGADSEGKTVSDPHGLIPYSKAVSYLKLVYFIFQYNLGWVLNIYNLKIRSSLVIFDRYYDDLLVDNLRYRYSGSIYIAKFLRQFIPKPDIYFILSSESRVIHNRKKEVSFEELERQIDLYQKMVDGIRYIGIDVNNEPESIVIEIKNIIMKKMNERY